MLPSAPPGFCLFWQRSARRTCSLPKSATPDRDPFDVGGGMNVAGSCSLLHRSKVHRDSSPSSRPLWHPCSVELWFLVFLLRVSCDFNVFQYIAMLPLIALFGGLVPFLCTCFGRQTRECSLLRSAFFRDVVFPLYTIDLCVFSVLRICVCALCSSRYGKSQEKLRKARKARKART